MQYNKIPVDRTGCSVFDRIDEILGKLTCIWMDGHLLLLRVLSTELDSLSFYNLTIKLTRNYPNKNGHVRLVSVEINVAGHAKMDVRICSVYVAVRIHPEE